MAMTPLDYALRNNEYEYWHTDLPTVIKPDSNIYGINDHYYMASAEVSVCLAHN